MKMKRQKGFSLIELLIVVAIIGIIAAIAIPSLLRSQQAARETAAVAEVKNLGQAQLQYSVTKGRGKFGDLSQLAAQQLINAALVTGAKGGYIFTCNMVEADGAPPMYDTTAKPSTVGLGGMGNVSYYSNESNVIYEAEGAEPPTATPQDRVPQNGQIYTR